MSKFILNMCKTKLNQFKDKKEKNKENQKDKKMKGIKKKKNKIKKVKKSEQKIIIKIKIGEKLNEVTKAIN
jgi:hypothetical protein